MDIIKTSRYILKKVEKNDAEDIFKILSNPKVIDNLNMKIHENIEDTRNLLIEYFEGYEEKTKFPYAIFEKDTKEFLGVFLVKLDLYDYDCFEFTIYINDNHWGEGIYTEVLPYMIKFAFNDIKTGNFRGFVMEKNKASSRVLEKCGFKLEKIFEVDGLEGKIYSYLITKEQYKKMIN